MRILFSSTGCPGAYHDNRVWQLTPVFSAVSRYQAAITKSGNGSLEGQFHTFFSCAKEEEQELCQLTLENLYSAFGNTTQLNPEVMDMGSDEQNENNQHSLKAINRKDKQEPKSVLDAFLEAKTNEIVEQSSSKEQKEAKSNLEMDLLKSQTISEKALAYERLKNAGMSDDQALAISGLI